MTQETKPRYWQSPPPLDCDICHDGIDTHFVDAATRRGWGCLCDGCHAVHGFGLGIGKGQRYEKQPDGKWLKVGG